MLFYRLPAKIRLGVIFHELGHLLGAIGELKADKLANKTFGIAIKRINSKYGKNLESL